MPRLDLPEGISVAPEEEHDYVLEIWRRRPPDPGWPGASFIRLGFIDKLAGHVQLDDETHEHTPLQDPQHDVDWVLRRAPAPHGPDGRATGYPAS